MLHHYCILIFTWLEHNSFWSYLKNDSNITFPILTCTIKNIDRRVVQVILIRYPYKGGTDRGEGTNQLQICTQSANNSVRKGISQLQMIDWHYYQHFLVNGDIIKKT